MKAVTLMRVPPGSQAEAQRASVSKQLDALLSEYADLEAKLRASSPLYAGFMQAETLSASEIQRQLDPGTLLLEYSLGEKDTFLWAVERDSIHSWVLGPTSQVEALARGFRAQAARPAEIQQADAAALGKILLGRVAPHLGKKKLIIVAEGILAYIPFAALPAPTAAREALPLSASHEIVYLPSASVIAALRRDAAGRKRNPLTAAVIADPVYYWDDTRVHRAPVESKVAAPDSDVMRSASELQLTSEGWRIPRLLFTRKEAQVIAALAPRRSVRLKLDFDADRAAALSPDLKQFRIVHFATHAFINNVHPELSGVVLSLVDRNGNAQDGFLRLHEIYNLDLASDLVVMSSCESGLGKEVRGEGLIGFTRGFLYAGASRALVSLWKVNDEATARLMEHFYEALLTRRMQPPAALRAAQTAMRGERRWRSPYYWAGFVLQGEWR